MDFGFKPGIQLGASIPTINPVGNIPAPVSSPTANRANGIPQAPMMSYNVKGNILQGVDDEIASKIVDYVNTNAKSGIEKKVMLQEAHQKAIELEQKKAFEAEREAMKQEMTMRASEAKDPQEKGKLTSSVKVANFADMIREGAKKEGFDVPTTMKDTDLINQHLNANPKYGTVFEDYMNGKTDGMGVLKGLGIVKEEVPVDERSGLEKGFTDVTAGALSSATGLPRFIASNLAKGVGWIAKELGADESKVQGLVDSYIASISEEQLAKEMGANTDSGLYKGTKIAGDIIQIANPAGLGKAGVMLGGKAANIASKVAGTGKVGKVLSKAANVATQGAVDTSIFMPVSENRMATAGEVAGGVALGVAGSVVGAAAGKAKNAIGNFGSKLYAKTINLNPSQIKKIVKPNIAGVTPEKRLIDRKISGNLSEIQTKLDDIAETSYKQLNDEVSKVGGVYKSESANSILSALKKKVNGIEGLEEINTKLDTLMGKSDEGYKLTELVDIKRTLDKRIKMYGSSGDPIAQETAEGLRNLRDRLWTDIDTMAEGAGVTNLRNLSKDIQVSTEISNALENTIARESKNRAMSLTDLIVGAGVGGGILAGTEDPVKALSTVAGLLVTKKVLENPSIRTKLALKLDKLAPKMQEEIKTAIQNNTPLKTNLSNMLRRIFTQIGVKALSNKESE